MGLTVHGSEFAKLEVELGGKFAEVPGVTGYSESGGEAPDREIVSFGTVAKRTGLARVPTVEVQAVYQPAHPVWKGLRKAMLDGTALRFQLETRGETVYEIDKDGHTAAIAAKSGAVTLVGDEKPDLSEPRFGEGMVLQIGSAKRVIRSISADGAAAVEGTDAVGAAKDYKILLPSLRRGPFPATVRSAGNVSLESEGDLTTTLSLSPRAPLPEWVIA